MDRYLVSQLLTGMHTSVNLVYNMKFETSWTPIDTELMTALYSSTYLFRQYLLRWLQTVS